MMELVSFENKCQKRHSVNGNKNTAKHKPMNDRLTILSCVNASGDCKLKPFPVCQSISPRRIVFVRNNRIRSKLWDICETHKKTNISSFFL